MAGLASLVEGYKDSIARRWRARVTAELGREDRELESTVLAALQELTKQLRSDAATKLHSATRDDRSSLAAEIDDRLQGFELLVDAILEQADQADLAVSVREMRVLTRVIASMVSENLRERAIARDAELRFVTDALPVLVTFVTAEERYGFVNRAYEDWFGVKPESLLGRRVEEVAGPAAYEVIGPLIKRALAGESFTIERHDVPYDLRGKRDIKVMFVPRRDSTGVVTGYVALADDITDARRLARERERLAAQRTEVLESMVDAFCALDAGWRIILVNRQFERMTELSRDQLLERVFWDAFADVAGAESVWSRELRRCMSERVEVDFIDGDSIKDRWTEVRAYPTADGGASMFVRDITAKMRAEDALQRQSEFEQQLIGIVSHDLRNPLGVISGTIELLTENEGLADSVTRSLLRIRSAADRATRMVSDLLDFTQARLGGGIPIRPLEIDVHHLVNTVVGEVATTFPTRQVDVQHEGDGRGTWDPDRLSQVVQNLVTNALEHSPDSAPVRVDTQGDETHLSVCVHNLGTPIPAAQLPIVFEPFQRGNQSKRGRSVGLGLFIVRQIVEAHGGSVTIRSVEVEGTTVSVVLPRVVTSRLGK